MIAEAALSALDQKEDLSKLAKQVGVLTPSFLGHNFIRRLERTGLFTFATSDQLCVLPAKPQATIRAKL